MLKGVLDIQPDTSSEWPWTTDVQIIKNPNSHRGGYKYRMIWMNIFKIINIL